MKWVFIVLAILASLVIVIVVIGSLLPKSHRASRKLRLPKSVGDVWAILTDFPNHPTWRKSLKGMEKVADDSGKETWREKTSQGDLTLQTTESSPPRKMVRKIVDKNLPFGGEWVYELVETKEGCELTITENGEVYNPLFRFVSKFLLGHTGSIDEFLKSLAAKSGSTALPEDA